MPSGARYLRAVGSPVRPVTTPVPWGTAANPANLPMPRGDAEWDRASQSCSDTDALRLAEFQSTHGADVLAEICGDGFTHAGDLSDYAAWMAVGICEMRRYEVDARAAEEKDDVLLVAGAHYRARPVMSCSECGHDTPHTHINADVAMCLVCGDRSMT